MHKFLYLSKRSFCRDVESVYNEPMVEEQQHHYHNIFSYKIPLWILICALAVTAALAAWSYAYLREPVYEYELTAPLAESSGKIALAYGASPSLSQPDFFAHVRNQFIEEKVSFISANLADMKVALYQEGELVREVSILSKGREGSWWETPAGLYKVESK